MSDEHQQKHDEEKDVRGEGGDEVRGDKITTGDISGTGIAVGRGAAAQVSYRVGGDEQARLFERIYRRIEERAPDPDVDKDEIREQVRRIEEEVGGAEEAVNANRLERWLRNLALMAPDIFEVTVATIASPAAGFATIARKVAEKAKGQMGSE